MNVRDNIPLGPRADEIIRLTASYRGQLTRRNYEPLLCELLPVRIPMTLDDICNRFRAFEREINPRWDGSIA